MYQWPDLMLPPINLWSMPKQNIVRQGLQAKSAAEAKPRARVNTAERLRHLLKTR